MKARKPKTDLSKLGRRHNTSRMAPKLALWLKHYTTPGTPGFQNAAESARMANYQCRDDSYYTSIGWQNYVKLRPLLEKWMDEQGLTPLKIKSKVLSLMDASKTHFEKVKGDVDPDSLPPGVRIITQAKGKKIIDEEGNEIEYPGETVLGIDVDALEIQVKGADLAAKVRGLYEPESRSGPKAILNVTIEVYRDPDAPIPVGPLKIAEKTA